MCASVCMCVYTRLTWLVYVGAHTVTGTAAIRPLPLTSTLCKALVGVGHAVLATHWHEDIWALDKAHGRGLLGGLLTDDAVQTRTGLPLDVCNARKSTHAQARVRGCKSGAQQEG